MLAQEDNPTGNNQGNDMMNYDDDDDTKTQPLGSNNDQNSNSAQYKFVWQWPENDGTWHNYDATTQLLLDQLSIGQQISISAGKWTYSITKTSNNSCSYGICFSIA